MLIYVIFCPVISDAAVVAMSATPAHNHYGTAPDTTHNPTLLLVLLLILLGYLFQIKT